MFRGVWQSEGDSSSMANDMVPKGCLGHFSKAGTVDGSQPTAQFGETGRVPSSGQLMYLK